MKIATVAIQRPVFAAMVILVPIVFGVMAYSRIAIEQYPSVDPRTRTIELTAVLDNGDGALRPGLMADVALAAAPAPTP